MGTEDRTTHVDLRKFTINDTFSKTILVIQWKQSWVKSLRSGEIILSFLE